MAQQNNRNSPHLNSLQNGSAPPSPSMSNSQQAGGQSRQPVSYPSPTSYPSPSMSSAQYNYPPPNSQQVSEPYRASPTGSNGSLSLPSMRSLDPLQQQQVQAQAQAQQQHMGAGGSPLPPPVAQMGGPYYHNQGQTLPHPSHQYPNVTSDPVGQNMRYALPVTDSRQMSGGRHKKEIKRRTKTGCLTCRKRRIKCDEEHPACRNCQKSKRECMGYDPIFKQQPGPAAIQPAPSSGSPQPTMAAPSNPYGNQSQVLQGGYGAGVPNLGYDTALTQSLSPGGSVPFDFASAIDPSLEAAAPPAAVPNHQFHPSQPGMHTFRHEDLKTNMHNTSLYSSHPSDALHLRGGASSFVSFSTEDDTAYTTYSAKRTIGQIFEYTKSALSPPTEVSQSPAAANVNNEEIKRLYFSIYAPGLENFLETRWFTGPGLNNFLTDKDLVGQFAVLLDSFKNTNTADPDRMTHTANVEGQVVWSIACMVRAAAEANKFKSEATSGPAGSADDPTEAAVRLSVFEDLVTGKVATENNLVQPIAALLEHHKVRELEFWYTLGNFICLNYEDPNNYKDIDASLATMRNLLDGRENRDVLYSIAVFRALGGRCSDYNIELESPSHFDESDIKAKFAVAKKFIVDEATGAGTTNVIRRFCDLATRSWTIPWGQLALTADAPQQ